MFVFNWKLCLLAIDFQISPDLFVSEKQHLSVTQKQEIKSHTAYCVYQYYVVGAPHV